VHNILTIDVEDWYQSSVDVLRAKGYPADGRPMPSPRVVENTMRLLDILSRFGAKATCFVLGTVAEAYPSLVRRIADAGHEVATHGYGHELVYNLDREAFRADIALSKRLLEEVTGRPVEAYRAPYFSITPRSAWALDVLAESGIKHDSSIFPIRRGLYGFPGGKRFPHAMGLAGGRSLLELPVSTLRVLGANVPFGGGGYFRLAPYRLVRKGLESLNRVGQAGVFYVHPYELDTEELKAPLPAENRRTRLFRWSQRLNREKTEAKIDRLLGDFAWTSIREWTNGGNSS
jgi:polysaccharide deacetylase family protein (PEP-CTERM system associated)